MTCNAIVRSRFWQPNLGYMTRDTLPSLARKVNDPTQGVIVGEANGNKTLYPPEDRMLTVALRGPRGNLDKVKYYPNND
jgi:hypothetical protein